MWIEETDFEDIKCVICDSIIIDAKTQYNHHSRYGPCGAPRIPKSAYKLKSIRLRGKMICINCANSINSLI